MTNIRIGILGYGNLGRGVELAIRQTPDIELAGVFTRRDPSSIKLQTEQAKVYHIDAAASMKNDIDVMILCGGSATDLIHQSPELVKDFNIVDSFDTHARIPEHFANVDAAAKNSGHLAIISAGWDPGLFSINRLIGESVLPDGDSYTFWGKGVSQGHSDAIRRIDGVASAVQYTIPIESAMEEVRKGTNPSYTPRQKHTRECFVVAKSNADQEKIRAEIVNMPNYFSDYDTTVHFISQEEFSANHIGMPHGGFVLRSGSTGKNRETSQLYEFSLKLGSNPEFTASVLLAFARAAYKLANEGFAGAKTVLEIPPAYLSSRSIEELRQNIL